MSSCVGRHRHPHLLDFLGPDFELIEFHQCQLLCRVVFWPQTYQRNGLLESNYLQLPPCFFSCCCFCNCILPTQNILYYIPSIDLFSSFTCRAKEFTLKISSKPLPVSSVFCGGSSCSNHFDKNH